jgi:hypothetical protein
MCPAQHNFLVDRVFAEVKANKVVRHMREKHQILSVYETARFIRFALVRLTPCIIVLTKYHNITPLQSNPLTTPKPHKLLASKIPLDLHIHQV